MTQEEFSNMADENMRFAASMRKTHPSLRLGQCLYNLVYALFPEESDKVPTDMDPFYKDENIPKFWEFMKKELVN